MNPSPPVINTFIVTPNIKFKICLVESTGELEALLLYFLNNPNFKSIIFDITPKIYFDKNEYLYRIFEQNIIFRPHIFFSRFVRTFLIIMPGTLLSFNCVNNFLLKSTFFKKYFLKFHLFFRDSLTPHFNTSKFDTSIALLTLICEPRFKYLYPCSKFIYISDLSIDIFLSKLNHINIEKENIILILSKNYGRHSDSLLRKELILNSIRSVSYNFRVVCCPHPRESIIENDLYKKLSIDVFNGNIYQIVQKAKIIINLGTSAAYPLNLLKLSFINYIDTKEFSSTTNSINGRWTHLSEINIFDNLSELKDAIRKNISK